MIFLTRAYNQITVQYDWKLLLLPTALWDWFLDLLHKLLMGNICEARNTLDLKQNFNLPKQLNFHKFLNTLVFLDVGDIKEEEVDVIVCQTDVKLNLPSSLTHNMTVQAKRELTKELGILKGNKHYVYGDVFYTHAEELEFDYVFYCVLPDGSDPNAELHTNSQLQLVTNKKAKKLSLSVQKGSLKKHQRQYIYDCVIKCIKLAEELEINSLSLPMLVATMMLVTVKHYVEENQAKMKHLNQIRFCMTEHNHVEAFTWSFLEVCKNTGLASLSDSNSDSMSDSGDRDNLEDLVLTPKSNSERQSFREMRELSFSKYGEQDEFENFGVSYQDKIQGVSVHRKGSL